MEEEWKVEQGGGKVKRMIVDVGKKMVITGAVISSSPILIPPLLVGFAFAVPFGLVFATYACTDKIMSKLLSSPIPPPAFPTSEEEGEFGRGGEMDWEEEEFLDDTKGKLEMRIELLDNYDDGQGVEGNQMHEIDDYVGGDGSNEEAYALGNEGAIEEDTEGLEVDVVDKEEDYLPLNEPFHDENAVKGHWDAEDIMGDEMVRGHWDATVPSGENLGPDFEDKEEVEESAMPEVGESLDEGFFVQEEEEKSVQVAAGTSTENVEEEKPVQVTVDTSTENVEEEKPTRGIERMRQEDRNAYIGGWGEGQDKIPRADAFDTSDNWDEQVIQEDEDVQNAGKALVAEEEMPVESISQTISQSDGPIEEKRTIRENRDEINVGLTAEAGEIPVEETSLEAEAEAEAGEEEKPAEMITQSVEQVDEPVLEKKGLENATRIFQADDIPIDGTSLSIDDKQQGLLDETKEVGEQAGEKKEVGEKAQGEDYAAEIIQMEELSVEETEEEKQPLWTETKEMREQAHDEDNMAGMVQVGVIPIVVPLEGTINRTEEKQQVRGEENASSMIEIEISTVEIYNSIEEESMPLLNTQQGKDEGYASKMIETEKIHAEETFDSIAEEDESLLSERKKVPEQYRDEESASKTLENEQRPMEGMEESDKKRESEINIDNAKEDVRPLEKEVGSREDMRLGDNYKGCLNDQVKGIVRKIDEEMFDNNVEENKAMIESTTTMEKQTDEKIAACMPAQVRIVSDEETAREVADESGLYLFDEETADSGKYIICVNETHEVEEKRHNYNHEGDLNDQVEGPVGQRHENKVAIKPRRTTKKKMGEKISGGMLENVRLISDEKTAREIADESGLYLFDAETVGSEQYILHINVTHENDVTPEITSYSSPSADILDHEAESGPHASSKHSNTVEEQSSKNLVTDSTPHPISFGIVSSGSAEGDSRKEITAPTTEVLHKEEEERIWEKIDAIKKIVGYKSEAQASCKDEVNALYVFTGVEPPLEFKDSDLVEIHDKLRLLMAIIGVK